MSKKITYLLVLFVLCSMCVDVTKGQMVQDGLVAYWSLDANTISGENVKDVVGGNDGVITGSPVQVAGKINGALEFDGASSVDVTGTDALNFNGKTEMTVAVWAKPGNDDPVVGVVAGCCGSIVAQRDANSWALRYDGRNPDQEFEFIVCPNWQGDSGFGAPKSAPGEWHYLTAVVAVDKRQLYLDGELVIEDVYEGPMSSGGPETDIGHASDGGFVGVIDEVAIYDKALSASQIKQNFSASGLTAVNIKGKLATCWGEIKK